jgi:hypothetical protein
VIEKRVIELEDEEGNVFNLLALADQLAEKRGLNRQVIFEEMTSSDYKNLLEVFMNYFKDDVILTRFGSIV